MLSAKGRAKQPQQPQLGEGVAVKSASASVTMPRPQQLSPSQ